MIDEKEFKPKHSSIISSVWLPPQFWLHVPEADRPAITLLVAACLSFWLAVFLIVLPVWAEIMPLQEIFGLINRNHE